MSSHLSSQLEEMHDVAGITACDEGGKREKFRRFRRLLPLFSPEDDGSVEEYLSREIPPLPHLVETRQSLIRAVRVHLAQPFMAQQYPFFEDATFPSVSGDAVRDADACARGFPELGEDLPEGVSCSSDERKRVVLMALLTHINIPNMAERVPGFYELALRMLKERGIDPKGEEAQEVFRSVHHALQVLPTSHLTVFNVLSNLMFDLETSDVTAETVGELEDFSPEEVFGGMPMDAEAFTLREGALCFSEELRSRACDIVRNIRALHPEELEGPRVGCPAGPLIARMIQVSRKIVLPVFIEQSDRILGMPLHDPEDEVVG